MGVLGLFILGSCNSKPGNNPEEHNHGTEAHDHDHEGHDHENEGHSATKECEGHNHGSEASESEHSDEIILPKAKAEAAGVKVSTIEPGTFEQVLFCCNAVVIISSQLQTSGTPASRHDA